MSEKPYLEDLSREFIQETLDEIRLPVEIAIFGVDNGFNIGGIIRTAHSYLVSKIHFVDVNWYYEKAALTTLRWEKKNIVRWESEQSFLSSMKDRSLIAFEKRPNLTTKDIRSFQYPESPVLIFGSEKTGIPDQTLDASENVVSIPMLGLSNDFNVSVAFGIAMYDWHSKYTSYSPLQEVPKQ